LSILPHLSHLQFQDFINTMSLSLISSVLWVPRGASAQHPRRYDLSDPAELERVERLGKIKLEDARRELEELEKGVDGMQVDAEEDDDNGEEWESDNSADEPSESEDSESGDGEDPEKKARKMQASIKQGAAAGSKANGVDDEEDEMKKYNLDSYDTEVSKSKSANYFDTAIGKRD
jgi:periodic tryptophan protein 1